MSTSLICIAHSTSFECPPPLIQSALACVKSFYMSTLSGSPEFTPNITVLRANPFLGCQCIYQHFLPSTSHATQRQGTALHIVPTKEKAKPSTTGAATQRCTRSVEWVTQQVQRGLQSSPLQPVKEAAEASSPCDPWRCLAGALLMSCAVLHKQSQAHRSAHTLPSTPGTVNHGEEEEGQEVDLSGPTHRGLIVVLSEGEAVGAPVSFTTECAFAKVAVMLAKRRNVSLSCFGGPFSASKENGAETVMSEACDASLQRLFGMVEALNGICASKFHPSVLGQLLSPARLFKVPNRPGEARAGEDTETRLARAYIVAPVAPAIAQKRGRTALTGAVVASHKMWLCPRCLGCVVDEKAPEAKRRKAPLRAGDQRLFTCPLCC